MYIVVGFDDAKKDDSRYTPPNAEWLEEILYLRELTREECWRDDDLFNDYRQAKNNEPGYSLCLSDMLYNPTNSNEFVDEGVIGLLLRRTHDDQFMRALSTFHSEFEEAGHWRIPTLDKDKHSMRYRHYGYTDEDIANNMFVSGVFESMPAMSRMHWDRAQHYLNLIGWTITKPELRYLLVWDWG
jgi:hypothetical protein